VGLVVRATTYTTLFIGVLLVYLPAQALAWMRVARPADMGLPQVVGGIATAIGATVALWCVLTFVVVGRGTPAPFDPPRRLVIRGPYRHVRNPMYLGAGLAISGAALFYEAGVLLAYAALFMVATHLLVVWYEEPTLGRTFGADYEAYCRHVRRWWPRV